MPTYDYRCKKCDHVWEEFQSIKAPPSKKCPACRKQSAERQISAGAGILFKGSGFYLTDYRSDSYKKAAAADSSSGGGSSAKSESGGSKEGGGAKSKPAASKE
ncbi:FmdB family zinc ribbon protein [Planctomyces sp. SH-PL14]|uniref:FmdB family zinc ribbon protein n=1 Tax=Planctomyces sp. SH-PL14 TaxID=1632864 RepID=UPI00078D6577|nr:zinc ribbon domain-containing protein [Planctomyces sp. SH-PL14]AMV17951.1 Zinc ribbon domain protein [Planctomyces sp. SH-PL14]